jgi:UDP-N-acetylmuramoylalanine--D-glutamate ligase
MNDLRGKRVVVIGLGASGIAACRLLAARGAKVVANDAKSPDAAKALASEGIEVVLGGHEKAKIAESDLLIVSPGVPLLPEIAEAEKKGIPIWGEIELAVRMMKHPAPVIAIGGTNGKSTVTSLVGELLARSGKSVFVGGNLGEPLAAHADEKFDVVVLEVSSFQMERVDTFEPKVSVLLNITPDHLDRYDSMEAYAHAKGNAFVRQTEDDLAVIPADDPLCLAQAKRGNGRIVTFGANGDFGLRPRFETALKGRHNALNVAASLAAVSPWNLDDDVVANVLGKFNGLPHRMVLVRKRGGVSFYDDSKGTNVGASVTALRGVEEDRVVLIAGGKDKGGSYEPLVEALREKGRAVVLIGEASDLIAKALDAHVPHVRALTMEDAVRIAADLAKPGDAVLLSPACSSFDMFKDYKERGDAFVRAVEALS